ncbi:hypothetical protein HKX48_004567 [Thoreauomyces humboldtii]|nr:hypothetical protein HKX48_004567 [Thoreauomyces humboldtii]
MLSFKVIASVGLCALLVGVESAVLPTSATAQGGLTPEEMQKIRIDFLESTYNTTVPASYVQDVSSEAIRQVSGELAVSGSTEQNGPAPSLTPSRFRERADVGATFLDAADWTNTQRFQLYAGAAYCLKWHFNTKWDCLERCTSDLTAGTQVVDYFTKDSTVGFVAYNDQQQTIIVSFRGSLFPLNFFRDLQLFTTDLVVAQTLNPPAGTKIHEGFQTSYLSAQPSIRAAVSNVLSNPARAGYKIAVTGHSLGGAIALPCALDLLEYTGGNNVMEIHSYGEPRVGNSIFAQWVNTLPITINRVTGLHDPIPTIPRRSWLVDGSLDYEHHDTENYVTADKDVIQVCPDGVGGEPTICLNGESDLAVRDIASILTPIWIYWHLDSYSSVPFGPWC